jgi:hypothetical protein
MKYTFIDLVLDELDKSKKGNDTVNIKTREVIRYLDRRTKSRHTRTAENATNGSLRMQGPEEMFPEWEDCEKLMAKQDADKISKEEIPRHFRAMINCVLFQRSKGNELCVVTEDADFATFAERWNVNIMTGEDLENASTKAIEKYHRDIKTYESRKRTGTRNSPPTQRSLWTPK